MAGLRTSVFISVVSFLLGTSILIKLLRLQKKLTWEIDLDWATTFSPSLCRIFIGLLFTHWIADSLTLWKSPSRQTDLRLWTSATYYAVLTRMPAVLAYFYGAVVALGGATLFWSFSDGRAGNLMFDGGSACEFLLSLFSTTHSGKLIDINVLVLQSCMVLP